MTTYAADYSFDGTLQADPGRIKAAGYGGVLRYVSRPNSNGKNITAAEAGRIRGAGLDLTLNFEQYETRPREGYAAGVQDALTADNLANGVGYPATCAVYFSVDTSIAWESCRAYFQGVKATLRRPIGIYGGTSVGEPALNEGLVWLFWQANAGSWSGATSWDDMLAHHLSPHASLVQHVHNRTPLHIAGVSDDQFDPNTVLHDNYGQWLAPGRSLGDNDLGYSQWNDLEKLAFSRDVRNLILAVLRGQPWLPGQPNDAGDVRQDGLWADHHDLSRKGTSLGTIDAHVLSVLAKVSTGTGGVVDASTILEAIKALPAATIRELKAAL